MKSFKSVQRQIPGGFLTDGDHLVTIEEIIETKSKSGTPQIQSTLRGENGVITVWHALEGYKKLDKDANPDMKAPKGFAYRQGVDKDGNAVGDFYLTNVATGERVKDEENTNTALEIFGGYACDAGIEAGSDFELSDLKGRTLGVRVRGNDVNRPEVHYTMPAAKVSVLAS